MSSASHLIMAQNLDPLKLMNKYLGAWEAKRGKDTVEIWDFKTYGTNGFIVNIYQIVDGKRLPVSFNPISYDPITGKFFGFVLLATGNYGTWIGSFTSETKFDGDMLSNFNTQAVYGRLVNEFKNPNEWVWTGYYTNGVKFLELDFVKSKM